MHWEACTMLPLAFGVPRVIISRGARRRLSCFQLFAPAQATRTLQLFTHSHHGRQRRTTFSGESSHFFTLLLRLITSDLTSLSTNSVTGLEVYGPSQSIRQQLR